MTSFSLLSKNQKLFLVIYLIVLPLAQFMANWFDGGISMIGIIFMFPFLLFAWIGGLLFASLFGSFISFGAANLIGYIFTYCALVYFFIVGWKKD